MSQALEGILRENALSSFSMGYIERKQAGRFIQSPLSYRQELQQAVRHCENKGLVADSLYVRSDEVHKLDYKRCDEGVTLCLISPERLDENSFLTFFQCVMDDDADGRYFFTHDARTFLPRRKKSSDLLLDQKGTQYEHLPFVDQDFVLLFTYSRHFESIINQSLCRDMVERFVL